YHLASYWASGTVPRRVGSGTTMIAPYEAFATRDGHLVIAAGNDRLFARLCETLGQPGLSADGRFVRNADRVTNRETLHALIEAQTKGKTTHELADALEKVGVPASPIQATGAVAADPQALAPGIVQTIAPPPIPALQSIGLPLLIGGVRPPLRRHPPVLGEHTREVLTELGFGPEQIAAFGSRPD